MKKILTLIFILLLLGCDLSFKGSHRSGTVNDDYIEESVPNKYKEYAESTNYFMDAFTTKQFTFIASNYIAPQYLDKINKEELEKLNEYVEKQVGSFRSYLPGQWGFVPEVREGENLLHSVKIVVHEKATLHYIVTFLLNGKEHKVIGLTIKDRKGVRAPSEL